MQISSNHQSVSLAAATFPKSVPSPATAQAAPAALGQGQLFGWMSGLELLNSGWQQFMGSDPFAQQSAPFFSNYLEDQRPSYDPGPFAQTMAYPSDGDASGPPISATMAYPSDSDVGGPKRPPISATMAYPSDSDVGGPKRPPISATMAYPSDSDVGGPKRPPISATMAYPSDSDVGGPRRPPIADGLPFEPPIKRPIADGLPFEPPIKRPIADGLPFEPPIKRPPVMATMAYPSDSDRA